MTNVSFIAAGKVVRMKIRVMFSIWKKLDQIYILHKNQFLIFNDFDFSQIRIFENFNGSLFLRSKY